MMAGIFSYREELTGETARQERIERKALTQCMEAAAREEEALQPLLRDASRAAASWAGGSGGGSSDGGGASPSSASARALGAAEGLSGFASRLAEEYGGDSPLPQHRRVLQVRRDPQFA